MIPLPHMTSTGDGLNIFSQVHVQELFWIEP